MLVFTEAHIFDIQDGRKTQTRRIWKRRRAKPGSYHIVKNNRFGERVFGRIEILGCYQERLGAITNEDAKAEGYKDATTFLQAFKRINEHRLTEVDDAEYMNLMVWVVKFKHEFLTDRSIVSQMAFI